MEEGGGGREEREGGRVGESRREVKLKKLCMKTKTRRGRKKSENGSFRSGDFVRRVLNGGRGAGLKGLIPQSSGLRECVCVCE